MSSSAAALLRRSLRLPFSASLTRRPILPGTLRNPSSLVPVRSSSSNKVQKAEENLKRALKREIDIAKHELRPKVALPDVFPFEIIDNPGEETITLEREYEGEIVKASVFMSLEEFVSEDNDGVGESEDGKNDNSYQPTLSLVVKIDKGRGHTVELGCRLSAGELSIESVAMKKRDVPDCQKAYEGPQFFDLDDSLQIAFHNYLEARCIDSLLFDFLQEYMAAKEVREYMLWLNNIKKVAVK